MIAAQKNENDNSNVKTIHINMTFDFEISENIARFCDRLAKHIVSITNIGKLMFD